MFEQKGESFPLFREGSSKNKEVSLFLGESSIKMKESFLFLGEGSSKKEKDSLFPGDKKTKKDHEKILHNFSCIILQAEFKC